MLDGEDLNAFVISANIHRRHITKGQQAMVVAMIYPEPEKGGRGKKAVETTGFSPERLSHARTVFRSAPDLAAEVVAGRTSLDAAYETVRQQTGEIRDNSKLLAKLKKLRPDLADQVDAETKSLEDAVMGP